jgi:hypothetical protein
MSNADPFKTTIAPWATPLWQVPDPDLSPKRARPVEQVTCGVLHTTGYGPGVERLDESDLSPEEIDLAYAQRLANVLEYKGHLFIGRTGGVWTMMPLAFVGYHTGSGKKQQYKTGRWLKHKSKPMAWWRERFEDYDTPLDFPAWAKGSPNKVSWGVDFLAPKPNDTYTDAQYRSGAKVAVLCATICGHPIDDRHITTHSDVHPLDRTNKWGPWDLGTRWDRDRFWREIREEVVRQGVAS